VIAHERQISAVLVGDRRQPQCGIGQIDALFVSEPSPAYGCACNPDVQAVSLATLDDPPYLSVVEPNVIARLTSSNI
jgi:hypothetical protein